MIRIANSSFNCSEQGSKPKKLPLPRLNSCPICGGKGKVLQGKRGDAKNYFVLVKCFNCGVKTETMRPEIGESNRELKIRVIELWNNGFLKTKC